MDTLPVATLALLGAAHGINPAMGWLFAVGLGLQEQDRRAVWKALGPMALGHAVAIAVVVLLAAAVGLVLPVRILRWLVAAMLLTFGVLQLTRHRHPHWGGMRVGAKDLTIWSFLMASAHGAGLMVVPFVLGSTSGTGRAAHAAGHAMHIAAAGVQAGQMAGLLATLVHTAGYLVVTGIIAVVVYEKLGLRMLRSVWINLNMIWAAALVATAIVTPWL